MTTAAVLGANGRMGQRIIALASDCGVNVVERIDRKSPRTLRAAPQVLIDFSTPESTRTWLEICLKQHTAVLIGTTGLTPDDHAAIDRAAREIAVLQSPNMSFGVAAMGKLIVAAKQLLGADCDIDITETHHVHKKDAPSGTAIALAKIAGTDNIRSVREGEAIGTHTVRFTLAGERIELTHAAISRDTFARGAVRNRLACDSKAGALHDVRCA